MVSITPGGAQRSTAACEARRIAPLLLLVLAWPTNCSVPASWQVWPGVSPWITGAAGAVEQAASSAAAVRAVLRIDGLLFPLNHPAHLEFPIFDGEGEPPFDQVERVL